MTWPALEKLFAQDVVSYSDSNGAIRAAGRPLVGAASLAKIISGVGAVVLGRTPRSSFVEANGLHRHPAAHDAGTYAVITVTASAEGIDQVLWLVNPDKLAAFQ